MNGRTATLCNKYATRLYWDWRRSLPRGTRKAIYRGPVSRDVKRAYLRQPSAGRARVRAMMQRMIARAVPRETLVGVDYQREPIATVRGPRAQAVARALAARKT